MNNRLRREYPPYALVLEIDRFELLIDTRLLWKPPRVLVRRGYQEAEVWLDETDISIMRSKFGERDEEVVLTLVRDNFDDLLCWWCSLKDDVRRDRLERNTLVY